MRSIIILLAFLISLLVFSVVAAHEAALLRSEPANGSILPASPPEIRAWFGEEIQTGESTLQVFNADGQRVDSGDGSVDLEDPEHSSMVVSLPALPDGTYLVRWYVVLLDGDASESVFNFYVGDEAAAAAAGFKPADTTVLYYQPEDDSDPGPQQVISNRAAVIVAAIVALLLLITIMLRRKTT